MPRFYRFRDPKTGHSTMIEQPDQPVVSVQLQQPSLKGSLAPEVKRYFCTACTPKRPFAAQGVLSMHFKKAHPDLYKDKDSWRKFVGEWGDLSGPDAGHPDR